MAKPQVSKSTRLLDQLREQIRYLHYSLRTERAYVYCVKNFMHFHNLMHPRNLGQARIEASLTYLATQRQMSVSTHRQALSALLFLCQKLFGTEVPWMDELARPVPEKRIPVVLTRAEIQAVLGQLEGQQKLLASPRCRSCWVTRVSTTMIYTHVLKVAAGGTASPLDALNGLLP